VFVVTKASGRRSIILILCIIVAFVASVMIFTSISIDSNEKQNKLDALNLQLEQLKQENQEMDYLINNSDEAELYEHLARERGYAYPDEKVYYDVTPGK
jgi:cell division protein FtsB